MSEPKDPKDDWMRVFYQEAHANVTWAKNQGWRALKFSVLLLAAIMAAHDKFDSIALAILAFLLLVVGAAYLVSLNAFATQSREIGSCWSKLE